MKGTIWRVWVTGCALSAVAHAVLADGTIYLSSTDGHTFIAPIFQPNPANPTVQQVGQPSSTVYSHTAPTGTTVYGGLPVTSAYDLVLLYSLDNSITTVSEMSVATIVPFRTAAVATALPAGTILSQNDVPVPGTTGGTPVEFAIGAFFVDPAVADYIASDPSATPSQIYANAYSDFFSRDPLAQIGWGQIVTDIALGGQDTAGGVHPNPTTLGGWTSFSLIATPEPSTWRLWVFGSAVVLATRRFSQRFTDWTFH